MRNEVFRHDEIGRLTCCCFLDLPAGQALPDKLRGGCDTSVAYDPSGNITAKSDVGA